MAIEDTLAEDIEDYCAAKDGYSWVLRGDGYWSEEFRGYCDDGVDGPCDNNNNPPPTSGECATGYVLINRIDREF